MRTAEHPVTPPPEQARALLMEASPSLRRWFAADEGADEAVFGPPWARPLHPRTARDRLAEAADPDDLRRLRSRMLAAVAARDLCGLSLDPLTEAWSAAADGAVRAALRMAAEEQGFDGPMPAIFALGKHGSRELNWCSDVDLVCVRRADSDRRATDNLLRRAFAILDTPGPLGFVLRVDLDLRPEGRIGPLCPPAGAALESLRLYGRTWERAAWMRARCCAGDEELGERFLDELRPWVFRRHLDFTTLDALREIKDRIDSAALPKRGWDCKLGRGGIREIEFLAQARQLVAGGRNPALREPHVRRALPLLAEAGQLDAGDAEHLDAAYDFLRRLEHRIQIEEQRQTQLLPDEPEHRARLGRRMGFETLTDFDEALEVHRARVAALFEDFLEPDEPRAKADPRVLRLLGPFPDNEERRAAAEEAGFRDISDALRRLSVLQSGGAKQLSEAGRRDFVRAAPVLLDAVLGLSDPDRGLARVEALVDRLGARKVLYALLAENPPVTRALVLLLAEARAVSDTLLAHPELIDELVGAVPDRDAPTVERHLELLSDGSDGAPRVQSEHPEDVLAALRRYRHRHSLRVALAELEGLLSPLEASERLGNCAEALIIGSLRCSARWEDERTRRKEPGAEPLPLESFGVIAMGRLGAGRISHASDLDLMFVYRPLESVDAGRWTRLARRLINTMDASTREGRLYEVDLRLRPSGSKGLVVSSLPGWRAYLADRAAPFERLAMARARCLWPPSGPLHEEAETLIRAALHDADPDELAREARRMREAQRAELAVEGPDQYDLKYGPGGLADANFLAALVSRAAGPGAALRGRSRSDADRLRAASEDPELITAVEQLESTELRLRLLEGGERWVIDWTKPQAGVLAEALGYPDAPALRSTLDAARTRVGAAFAERSGA